MAQLKAFTEMFKKIKLNTLIMSVPAVCWDAFFMDLF
jgi:hypothetical protein